MSTKYCGYAGKAIKIDLSTREATEYEITDKDREMYLGGKAMAAKIIFDNIKKPIDAFDESNMLVFTNCPLTAMGCPSASRFNVSTISPQTGLYTSSNSGGNFGIHLKKVGYDALIITGKSEEKIFLEIKPNFEVKFHNADKLWGTLTSDAQEQMGIKGGKIVIGPAGENLVKFACAVSGERASGRCGVGAVMGSKNLKGIVCFGVKAVEAYDREGLNKINRIWVDRLKSHPITGKQLPRLGTAGLVSTMNAKHLLATKNYSAGRYEHFDKVSGETLAEEKLVRNKGCISCPIQCTRVVSVDGKDVKGPEVETLGLLGPNILNDNLDAILKWNYELDEYGMDTISFANTVAYAMEANEKGLWDNGLEFGKIDNIADLIRDTALQEGLGKEIALGSKRLSEKYGGKEFAMHSKGLEIAAYEPRAAVGQGLGYAVGNRGGCHLNGGYLVVLEGLGLSINQYTAKGKAVFTVLFQNLMEATSAGGNCLFTTYAFFPKFLISKQNNFVTKLVNKYMHLFGPVVNIITRFPLIAAINLPHMFPHTIAFKKATGMKMNFGRYIRAGERGYNIERMIDVMLGVSSDKDTLPKRLTDVNQSADNPHSHVPLDKLKKKYYKVRGWDERGIPTQKIAKRLKIEGYVYNGKS